jgi:hypothetical protein
MQGYRHEYQDIQAEQGGPEVENDEELAFQLVLTTAGVTELTL